MKSLAVDISSPIFTVKRASFKKIVELLNESGIEVHAFELVDDGQPDSGSPPDNAQVCKSFVRIRRNNSDQESVNEHFSRLSSPISSGRPSAIVVKNNEERKFFFQRRYCCRKCEAIISEGKRESMSRSKILNIRESEPQSDIIEYDERKLLDSTIVVQIDSSDSCLICG